MPEHVIDGGEVEVHLPGILWLEGRHLQIDDDEASKLQMVKKQIQLEILSSNFKRNLATDKGEAGSELNKELAQVLQQSPLQVALLGCGGEGQKIEVVRILDKLLSKIGLWRWQSRLKVSDCLSLPKR